MKSLKSILLLPSLFLISFVAHASDPAAVQCVEQFLEANKSASHYKTHLAKKEWNLQGGLLHDDQIEMSVSRSPVRVQLTYLNRGDTGIRNNGMRVEYDGSEKLKIKLGSTNVLGFLAHSAASAVIGDSMSIFDARALEDEIFTINRSGFDFLALVLGKHLDSTKTSTQGGLTLTATGTCRVKYAPHLTGHTEVTLQPSDSVFEWEEKLGTLAYIIWQENREKFGSMRDLLIRQKPVTISIPKGFYDTTFDFNPVTHLPDHFSLYQQGKLIGDYHFNDVQKLNP